MEADKTIKNALVDGIVVLTAAAAPDAEDMLVADFEGDSHGGWDHINVDHIAQTGTPRKPSFPNFASLTKPALQHVSRVPKFTYPGREDSLGAALRAEGGGAELNSLDAWQMKGIYDQ